MGTGWDNRFLSRRAGLIVAATALLSGANSLFNDFTYDDLPVINSNPAVTGGAPMIEIWTRDYWGHVHGWHANRDLLYRPLTLLSYRLNHAAGGLNPIGYHGVNLVLHAVVAALVVHLASRVGCPHPVPLIAGLLFAVMPIHVEAVAGVVGRAELLAGLFTLSAACLTVRPSNTEAGSAAGPPLPWGVLIVVSVLMLAALCSKESGIAALVLVPLFAGAADGEASAAKSKPAPIHRSSGFWFGVLAGVLCLAIYLPLRYHALGGRLVMASIPSPITNMLVDATPVGRFWGAWQLLGLYVAKTLWPATLCMDYSYKAMSLAVTPLDGHVLLGLATFAGLTIAAAFWWRRGRRGLAIVALGVLVAYLPVSNTFFLIKTLFAERIWYLPSAFGAIVLAAVGMYAVGRFKTLTPLAHSAALLLLPLILGAGLVRSWVRNADWRDNGTLFESAYRVHPGSAAILYAYGRHLLREGDPRGMTLLEQCVRIAPGLTDAQVELGRAHLRRGSFASALPYLQAAAMQEPAYPDVQEMLRVAASQVADERHADIEQLRTESRHDPNALEPLLRLCEALTQSGAVQEAMDEFAAAAERFGDRPEFHSARAVALMTLGRAEESIATYRRSLALRPEQPVVLAELAMALLDRNAPGDAAETAKLLEAADRLDPRNTQVRIARAEFLALQGRTEEAAAVFHGLIAELPPGEFRASLEARLQTLTGP